MKYGAWPDATKWEEQNIGILKPLNEVVFLIYSIYSMAHLPLPTVCLVLCLVLGIYVRSAWAQNDPLANFGDTIQVLGQVSLCINAALFFLSEFFPLSLDRERLEHEY